MSEHNLKKILAKTQAKLPTIRTHQDGRTILHDYLHKVARDVADSSLLHVMTTPGFTTESADEWVKGRCLQLIEDTWQSMGAWRLATPERNAEAEVVIVEAFRSRLDELQNAWGEDGGRA